MNRKTTPERLRLKKDTVRQLTPDQLQVVGGGKRHEQSPNGSRYCLGTM